MNRAIARKKKVLPAKSGAVSPRFFILVSLGALLLLLAFIIVVKSKLDSYNRQTFQYLIDGKSADEVKPADINDPLVTNKKANKVEFKATKVFGDPKAKVTVIYFSDYSCSFCQKNDSSIQKIIKKYGDKIYVVIKDYPDSDSQSKSFQLAKGGYCAYLQGDLWPYKTAVYRAYDKYDDGAELASYVAGQLAMKMNDFNSCFKDKETVNEVAGDRKDADNLGAFVVPFIKVNDQEFLGDISDNDLEKAVETELAK